MPLAQIRCILEILNFVPVCFADGKLVMLYGNLITKSYDYVYSGYGWFGVMFALMGLAFSIMMGYTVIDRRK